MPFNPEQLAYGAKAAIDFYVKNKPIDQINILHPLYSFLVEGKQEWRGGLQNVVEQIRFSNDSNFQAYFGDSQVTYNRKRTLDQAKFTWGSFHDGFGLNEDELVQNGITMTDDRGAVPTADEKVALTNLLEENGETLKLGFQENFDLMLHRDGTQSSLNIPGLDALVSTTPSSGTVGGILASNTWWRNYADLTLDVGTMLAKMELAWQACILRGGMVPDKILAGQAFVAMYRAAAATAGAGGGVQVMTQIGSSTGAKGGKTLDGGTGSGVKTGLYFKGVEIEWDPVFEQLDTLDAPATTWTKRCYFLNSKTIKLRPIKGHWLVTRRPPRVYDRYVHYTALTAKAAMTINKRNANAVLYIA